MPTFFGYDSSIAKSPEGFILNRKALAASSAMSGLLKAAAQASGFNPENIKTVRIWGKRGDWMQVDIASRYGGKSRRDCFHFPIRSVYDGLPKEMGHESKTGGVITETRIALQAKPHFSLLGLINIGKPYADEPIITRQSCDQPEAEIVVPSRRVAENFRTMREWALRVASRTQPGICG
jgi:hypothetical protein